MTEGKDKPIHRPTEQEVLKAAHENYRLFGWQVYPKYEDYVREVLREFQATEKMADDEYIKYREWRRHNLDKDIKEFLKKVKFIPITKEAKDAR